ncbi:MAG: ribosome maturation factor RimM [Pseudomonadota bacterium]
MSSPHDERMVVVAQFAGSHGVRGAFKLRSFTDDPEAVFSYGCLATKDGKPLTPKRLREVKPSVFLVEAVEISSPEDCDAYKGALLSVPRTALPQPDDEDDFYIEDLIGLRAVSTAGEAVGRVKAVPNYGAGDLIELQTDEGPLILPFTKASVPEIDLGAGRVTVELLEGEESSS